MKNIKLAFKFMNLIGCSCRRKQLYSTQADVRVRFAPSPTGLLHLGGLRTAVYNYLFAKSKGGVFVLRIEDTDQNRLVPGTVERLQTDLEWVGIIPDEGPNHGGNYGPYKQSQRLDLYKQEVHKLIKSGSAYYCFCTERRLDLLRKEALKLRQVPKYDNRCRHLSEEEIERKLKNNTKYCVRFKLSPGGQSFDDLVYGTITHDVASVEGDPIILKTDGFPTYHLANVVDDHYMKISHVLRGVEWQPSTAKHLLLYKAFQWKPPLFCHLPLLVNPDGTKFSKRQGANAVEAYRNDSIYPRSLINFVTFTGGLANMEGEVHSPRTFSMEELIRIFDLSYVNTHPCRLMFDQLPEFNRAELSRQISDENSLELLIKELRQLVIDSVATKNNDTNVCDLQLDDDHLRNILKWCPPRATKLKDLVEPKLLFLWKQPSYDQINSSDIQTHKELLKDLVKEITEVENFNQTVLNNDLRQFAKKHGIKIVTIMKILRLCLCGLKEGPGIGETMEILGKECCLRRLKRVTEAQFDNETSICRSRA